ncbi:MAG: hypothetical protein A2939_04425 [Parcubacteria group bacterium RIFCSPLOWO2_01_FULL_48_18]|nr:MAG: hypothetical protein A3J67_03695 [Parcubacteria group bacterium RIFCSPHIGHO2_02_FULL_48_10b]OHB22625.1 MAG: hypothetical protein A2939_04425 [Parcubacteria group bacterium RIFCSPLOWO2_01_FULL_48_18]
MKQYVVALKTLPIWKGRKIKISPLKGGMTNHNYLVKMGKKIYVARFAPDTLKYLELSRPKEIYNYRIAFSLGLGARITAYYPRQRLLIIEYLPGKILTPKKAKTLLRIKKIAHLLRSLHRGPKLKGNLSSFDRIRRYISFAERRRIRLPKDINLHLETLTKIEERLEAGRKTTPCHLDLMLENILETPSGKLKLLDWEYSGNADPRYDLAMFSIKASLDLKKDEFLVKVYLGKNEPRFYEAMQIMKAVVYFAEGAYGLIQLAISKKKGIDYKKYADENIGEFKRISLFYDF